MLQWFRRRADASRKAEEFYGSVVAAARNPAFYRDLGVPDTPEGRFELVALHLFLLLESLKAQQIDDPDILRRTIEVFVTDMDDCMREMGVGDMVVGKKVKRAAAAFYERAAAYRKGLGAPGADLEDSLRSYIFKGAGRPAAVASADGASSADGACSLASYVRAAAAMASQEPFIDLMERGGLSQLFSDTAGQTS